MKDRLLEAVFDYDRWVELIDKAEIKGIDKSVLRKMSEPMMRQRLFDMIVTETLKPDVPHIAQIPKDEPGKFREVVVSDPEYRVIYSIINESLFDLFPQFIHKSCKSYQTGESCGKTVMELSRKLSDFCDRCNNLYVAEKFDFSKYFDNVSLNAINGLIDCLERELGFEKGTECVCNFMRKVFSSDLVFDLEGNLIHKYMGIRQGCALASWFADAILYELDDFMSKKYECYYRYSDDLICVSENLTEVTDDIDRIIHKYGVSLNPKKIQLIHRNEFFKFLGFNIKRNMITLSKGRVKNFQKEIEARTIKHRKITADQAKRNVMKYLYEGDYNWATSCLGVINVKPDIDELNKFIMDCIRACETGKKKIGGLGSVTNLPDRTILRGTGKNVKANREKTTKEIDCYISVGCLSNAIKIGKPIYEAIIRGV